MTSRTVKSPAGETIEVVSDDDWLTATGLEASSLRQTTARLPVLGALWKHGEFVSANGTATVALHAYAKKLGYNASTQGINALMVNAAVAPAIHDNIKGRRRFGIRLVALPERWHTKIVAQWPSTNGHKPVELVTESTTAYLAPDVPPLTIHPLPPTDYAPALDLEVAANVAMSLLTQVVDMIRTGNSDAHVQRLQANLDATAKNLAARLNENEQLRRTVRGLQDVVDAHNKERDGLLQRLRMAEENLRRATSTDAMRTVNEQVQKELAKIMQTKPTAKAVGDE